MTFKPVYPRFFVLGLSLAVAIVLLDQWAKFLILQFFWDKHPLYVHEITSFFSLALVWNKGVSFGMFSDHDGSAAIALIAVAVAISLVLLEWLRRCGNRVEVLAIGLVLGGAIGNVIDRVRFGAVVDYLDFHVAGAHWPAFNVADSCICIGVVVLCIDSLFKKSA